MKLSTSYILQSENEHLKKLEEIVHQAINDEKLILDNLMNPPQEQLSKGQKISDKVARFGGSWTFITLFFGILLVWIIFNTVAIQSSRFDPYPFILMNLVLSCIAAFQAPIIMMSQNRQEEKDRKRSENDYLINLKAELEIRTLHQKMDLLLQDEIKILYETQAKQLAILHELEKKIENQLLNSKMGKSE